MKNSMKESITLTPDELREYVRTMPENTILNVSISAREEEVKKDAGNKGHRGDI